ncbi:MAG: hypothetical protein DMG82_26010 [Acidobacteria bacterium]|nr:MAG: hypothetical protein DMG82_26010 [Acidobacteriota bacterium]PYX47284.1 MAG: hypothetical protein DMG83_05075 [Acidobacteriota bacterium]
MKREILLLLPAMILLALAFLTEPAGATQPWVKGAARHDTSAPLRNMIFVGAHTPSTSQQQVEPLPTRAPFSSKVQDPVAQPLIAGLQGVTTDLNFEGQSAQDTRNIFGFAFVPPDTNGAPGETQFVQIVNVTIAIYDKRTGEQTMGPAAIHTLWTGFGGPCEFQSPDGGDPVVLYDHLANRWLISQLQFNSTFTQNEECVAVSTSSDATGSYNRYEFDFGANFPDYPKYGIWPDAYYNTVNVFPGKGFAGAEACAFDRKAMLAGLAANAICFQQPSSVSSLLPADIDGRALPPANSPNYLLGLADSTHLNLFKFHVDFANPGNSTFSGPSLISVAPFSEICARANTVACIAEPNPGEKVDGLSDRVMFRLAYRNFGDHESLVVNHTIAGGVLAGVRWYEIRNPGGVFPTVFQQGTIVDPEVDYWLGSVAMDKIGNLALGFSASGRKLPPSIYVAGRAPGDTPGVLSGPLVIAGGIGVQVQSFKRWGDYSSMEMDPTDDCTFWYTNEYYPVTGSFAWSTRIGSFRFNSCKATGR